MIARFIYWLINPKFKGKATTTAISRSYHRFLSEKREEEKVLFKNRNCINGEFFKVTGAGDIYIGENCYTSCGKRHVYYGGVLGRNEAIRMAQYILERTKNLTETEQEEVERYF